MNAVAVVFCYYVNNELLLVFRKFFYLACAAGGGGLSRNIYQAGDMETHFITLSTEQHAALWGYNLEMVAVYYDLFVLWLSRV